MKIGGIIAEYNPFHNGHAYQLQMLKKHCEVVIVVMSGSFVQRGDVAITDKFTRARYAVLNGADLVVELPTAYALSPAHQFAYGAVCILKALGTNTICFGVETDDTKLLAKAAAALDLETPEQSQIIRRFLSEGYSYPKALSMAFSDKYGSLLNTPNNVLGIEYLRAAKNINADFEIFPLKRKGVMHDASVTSGNIASASHIRSLIKSNCSYESFVPKNCTVSDIRAIEHLDKAIISAIRIRKQKMFENTAEITEGLENKIVRAANSSSTFEELSETVKSKRYTRSRINRIILNAFLGIDKELSYKVPNYIRVLAGTQSGCAILNNSKLDVVTKVSDYTRGGKLFETDITATDIASLCGKNHLAGTDFTTSPFILK